MTGPSSRSPNKPRRPRKGSAPDSTSKGFAQDAKGYKTPKAHERAHGGRKRTAAFQERALNCDGLEVVHIFGVHAVDAALRNPARSVAKLLVSDNAKVRLADALKIRDVSVEVTTPKALDRLLGSDTVHQGVLLETAALAEPTLEDLIESAPTKGPIVVLDQITDPHNVGAILRSAAVFGCAGVVMTRRNSPALSGVLAKSASGALELVPVHVAPNLARALSDLVDQGVRVIGLDGAGESLIDELDFSGACALVLGAEGKGLRQLTRERCSVLSRITAPGALSSLNVSNAAAVSLHVASMARRDG